MKRLTACTALALTLFYSQSFAETLTITPEHAHIRFDVRNLGVHTVHGQFTDFSGRIDYDPKSIGRSKVFVTIKMVSVDTGSRKRDEHLRNTDFFDVARFPNMTFQSNSIEADGAHYKMLGQLTIKEATKPVTVVFNLDPSSTPGHIIAHGDATINRHDFGIDYGNNFSIGKTIEIHLDVEAP